MKSRKEKIFNIKKIKKQVKGITLIALVVTIIVLLILAGVALNLTIGQNGIFSRAGKAAGTWKNAEANEQLAMQEGTNLIDEYFNGNNKDTDNPGVTIIDGVPIPDKFYYVGGSKLTGLVISDNPADEKTYSETTKNNPVPADGLVGNQFVWIPVTESQYIRNRTYEGIDISESAFTDKEYLPDTIQPDLKEETMLERIGAINEKAEKEAVISAGGFYIARFETGIEKDTLVSKKNAQVWNNMTQEEAKARAKNMIDTTHAKTALCSGIQWDVVMEFVDGKLDGATPAQEFNVKIGSNARRNDAPGNTGMNEADKVCNIYDLEANHMEFVAEVNDNQHIVRGDFDYGESDNLYSASSRAMTLSGTPSATFISCRIVLYVM